MVASDADPWLKTPLDPQQACIRILALHMSVDANALIECSLKVVSLNEDPFYATLSYVWGDPTKTRTIIVNGQRHEVTVNLYDFFNHLRQPHEDLVLWADALCINQSDEKEKDHQIGLMSRIYSQCKVAHIWLGSMTLAWQQELANQSNSSVALNGGDGVFNNTNAVLESLLKYKDLGATVPHRGADGESAAKSEGDQIQQALAVVEKAAEDKHLCKLPLFVMRTDDSGDSQCVLSPDWPSVMDCLNWIHACAWWGRVWTYQEAVLPRVDPQLHIGYRTVSLATFLEGMHTISGRRITIDGLSCDRCDIILQMNGSWWKRFNQSKLLPPIAVRQLRKAFASGARETSLLSAIDYSEGRQASEVRDHLFGILGLLSGDLRTSLFDLGYHADCGQLFQKCSWTLILQEESLNGLHSAIGLKETQISNLSSWAIDISNNRQGRSKSWRDYKACGGVGYTTDNVTCQAPWSELSVQGVRVASIGTSAVLTPEIEERINPPGPYRSLAPHLDWWRDMYFGVAGSNQATEESFWRTALRDRNPMYDAGHDHPRMTASQPHDISLWWKEYKRTGLTYSSGDGPPDFDVFRKNTQQFRELCTSVTNHDFFCTEAGEPGLGLHGIRVGDEIFALAAYSALAVLRPTKGSEDGPKRFQFVGPCYVDGWMDGKAERLEGKWESVVLC